MRIMAGRWLTIAMASTLAGNFNCAGLDRACESASGIISVSARR
jgi:hypothetical protein